MLARLLTTEGGASHECIFSKKWCEGAPDLVSSDLDLQRKRVEVEAGLSSREFVCVRALPSKLGEAATLITAGRLGVFTYILVSIPANSLIEHALIAVAGIRSLHKQVERVVPTSVVKPIAEWTVTEREILLRLNALIELNFSAAGHCYTQFANLGPSLLPPSRLGLRRVLDVLTQNKSLSDEMTSTLLSNVPLSSGNAWKPINVQKDVKPLGSCACQGSCEGGLLNSGLHNWWRSNHLEGPSKSYAYLDVAETWHATVVNGTIVIVRSAGTLTIDAHLPPEEAGTRILLKGPVSNIRTHPCVQVDQTDESFLGLNIRLTPEGHADVLSYITLGAAAQVCQPPLDLTAILTPRSEGKGRRVAISVNVAKSLFCNKLSSSVPMRLVNVCVRLQFPAGDIGTEVLAADGSVRRDHNGILLWRLPNLDRNSRACSLTFKLDGAWRPKCEVRFEIPKWSMSGITVSSLESGASCRGLRHHLFGIMSYTL